MRTTLTIDDDLMKQLKARAYRTGKPFKQIVNDAIRCGLRPNQAPANRKPYTCKTFPMGFPRLYNLDKALALAAQLEDEEITRKLNLKK